MRWDDFGNWMRAAPALPSDTFKAPPGWATLADNEQQVIDQHWDYHMNMEPEVTVEEGKPAMETVLRKVRDAFRNVMGDSIDQYHDFDLLGSGMVHVWPNFHPWGGFSRLLYRFRPHPTGNPDRSLMDVLLMAPWPEDTPRPPPAPIHYLSPDEHISDAPELGILGRIFLQDIANMGKVQQGLKTSRQGYVILGKLHDAPVRHLHDLYDKWMGFENGDYLARTQPPPFTPAKALTQAEAAAGSV